MYTYLNPIASFGKRKYSFVFPLFLTTISAVLLELYTYLFLHNPAAVGNFAIFVFVALIIYFSFRDGIKGGITATVITISYYLYIIYTRRYTGDQLSAGLITTGVLAGLYLFLAGVIGWLRQTIDVLIEKATDEKRRLQTIIQQLPVGVLVTDNTGRVVQANKQVDEILGVKIPLGFMIGKSKPLIDVKDDGNSDSHSQSAIQQTLTTGKPVIGKEYTLVRIDGSEVHIQVSASAIHNKAGNIVAAASIINNITEQKEIEARKDDFVNMASHELKTPITSLKLYIDLLQHRIAGTQDEKSVSILKNIKGQTERLQRLVNDLLDVSRLQTGKLSFDKEEFTLNTLVRDTAKVLQETTTTHTIRVAPSSPQKVYADKFRMYQVVTNLITNAIKYSPEGKKIDIKIHRDGNKVVVSIHDYGIGIAKSQQKKIFERLYQVNDDKEKSFPGFGMGLYISKEIIRRHKGSIWVESKKGSGSTFYFSLPVVTK